ncbi:clathrin interactor EPSIN 1 isoform X2 [Rhodamnia argentea]|uniref:Clathrin interactor EPSIN 1 isoform X2 n=1 Tax=Rhodamnia argentea TaxID=178133 RepID=A0A8B8P7S9_9MYRT|nr:clathrin interactor EPSIN 1 isoform X2 [Rhodamnia argentea]
MDFMKVFDQTVREIKREVNLKVLKVPEIEQKVLDATDNEPWGPHGSALAEIAQATKKFTECQMVMNVLWTRVRETGKDWRYVYKALAVVEYLVAHGSERAVDDIIEHTFQISSLSSFEYVEPSGKDLGINVRKKAENIVALLNNRDKIQEVRNKAEANRDKYFGLSSTGISRKSGGASFGSSSFDTGDRYKGASNTREGDRFSDSYKDDNREEQGSYRKADQGGKTEKKGSMANVGSARSSSKDGKSSVASKSPRDSAPLQSSKAPPINDDNGDDDFDPRGTSTSKSSAGNANQADLFGQNLIGDLLDAPISVPTNAPPLNENSSEVDLFADASFVSAPPVESAASSEKTEVDLFTSAPAVSSAVSASVDLFAVPTPVTQPETKPIKSVPTNPIVDPFAAVPLNNFDSSDPFGSFTFSSDSTSAGPSQNTADDSNMSDSSKNASAISNPQPRKDAFNVKSGIWADSLSRGLIDLNISAPKKVSLADVGVVGGLSDGSDERQKGPPTSFYMGRAMGTGSGLGMSGFTSSQATGGDDFFSSFASQSQYGSFKK